MIERTICICHYLIAHAKAAFRLIGTDPAVLGARKILAWLRRKRASQLTTRQIHNAMQGTFQRVDELEGPLEVLVEHGYLRLMPVEKKPGAGRPPASVLEVNPALYQFKSKFDSVDIVDTPLRIQDSAGRPE
jgi:replicative DNA helicase